MHEVPTWLMNAKQAPGDMVKLLTAEERVEHVRANQQRYNLKLTGGRKLVQSGKDQADYSSQERLWVTTFENSQASKQLFAALRGENDRIARLRVKRKFVLQQQKN